MRHPFHVAQAHWQKRLSPVEGLDLRLLVDAELHRFVWRTQIKADEVANLLDKERIGGVVEGFLAVRLH